VSARQVSVRRLDPAAMPASDSSNGGNIRVARLVGALVTGDSSVLAPGSGDG
jgi:hypothetical protein